MMEPASVDRQAHDGFDHVYIENDWYDGPRSGLAIVGGAPHYFQAVDSYHHPDEPDDEYFVWPATESALALEQEQWAIFIEWNTRYKAGTATVDDHPGHGSVSARYDELATLLAPYRALPPGARRLAADWHWPPTDGAPGYQIDGPGYLVKWRSSQQQPTTA